MRIVDVKKKYLLSMQVGDQIVATDYSDEIAILRVIGGWIYTIKKNGCEDYERVRSVFVPEPSSK